MCKNGTPADYIDGFVYINGSLSYITTPEGRVNYNGSTFTNEYIISDQQGNVRISFNNTGTGGVRKVVQENSYYGFGMILPNSPVTGGSNKNLYNGGSEWQNDFQNQPDFYQTANRNYDASLGRFAAVDPMAESSADMSTYHYAGDNPIMMNDPSGNNAAPTNVGGTDLFSFKGVWDDGNDWKNPDMDPPPGEGGSYDPSMAVLDQEATQEEQYQEVMAASTSIYHQGDGTDDDPTTGSLSQAVNAIVGGTAPFAITPQGSGMYSLTGNAGSNIDEGPWEKLGFTIGKERTGDGAIFIVNFKDPGLGYNRYNWIQTVSSSGEFEKNHGIDPLPQPHVDGLCDSNGNLLDQFFIFSKGNPDIPHTGMTSTFSDIAHGESSFTAELTLVGINNDGFIKAAGSFTWGYDKNNPQFIGPTFSRTPSPTQQGLIFTYNYILQVTK